MGTITLFVDMVLVLPIFFAQELLSFFFRGGLSKTLGHRFPFVKLSLQQQQHKYTHHFQQPKTTASTKLKLKVVQQQLL